MALQKVLVLDSTLQPQQYSPLQTSAGVGSAGQIPALNAAGLIDSTMLPTEAVASFTAKEAIAQGAFVNVTNVTGTWEVQNANATDATKPANGWAPNAISMGGTGPVNFSGVNPYVAAGTFAVAMAGQEAFLSTTAGSAVPSITAFATGNLIQVLGTLVATGATYGINFVPQIRCIF